jgi:hypothetical protein
MGKAMGGRGFLSVALLAAVVVLAGCGSSKSSSTTGATATQTLKRLEVTVVRSSAEAPAARPFLARAAELLGWAREAEAAAGECTVSAGGVSAPTVNGKATLVDVTVPAGGIIDVAIQCNGGPTSHVNLPVTSAPGAVVAVTVEVGDNKVEVKAKNEHVSEPKVSQPSPPDEPSKPKPS